MNAAPERKRLSPVASAVLGFLVLGGSFTVGALVERGRWPATDEPAGPGPAESAAVPPHPDSGISVAPGDVPRAGAGVTLAEARAEVERLRERVVELENLVPKGKTKEVRIAEAKEIVELLRKGKKDPRLFQLITDLDPAMGPYFIECLDNPNEKMRRRDRLCQVALSAGGPEVADWLVAKLTDVGTAPEIRSELLRVIGDRDDSIFTLRNLPVKGPLAELAFRFATDVKKPERVAGACLLGGVATVESRTTLYQLAASDPDIHVQDQAVRALATAGDRETLARLDTLQTAAAELEDSKKAMMQAAIDYARTELKKRFP